MKLRNACSGGEFPRPDHFDINIGLSGYDLKKEILIQLKEEDENIVKALNLNDTTLKGEDVLEKIKNKRIVTKDERIKNINQKMLGLKKHLII